MVRLTMSVGIFVYHPHRFRSKASSMWNGCSNTLSATTGLPVFTELSSSTLETKNGSIDH